MARARISATVDAERLELARRLAGMRDSQLLDRALAALIEVLQTEQELAALDAHPYEADPDLAWRAPVGPDLPYEGEVPADVVAEARRRRNRRAES